MIRSASANSASVYFVDGAVATRAQAQTLTSAAIDHVEVWRARGGGPPHVEITTKRRVAATTWTSIDAILGEFGNAILIIDGVRVDRATFRALDEARIQRLTIQRGPSSAKSFPDSDTADGVLTVTTKGALGRPE